MPLLLTKWITLRPLLSVHCSILLEVKQTQDGISKDTVVIRDLLEVCKTFLLTQFLHNFYKDIFSVNHDVAAV